MRISFFTTLAVCFFALVLHSLFMPDAAHAYLDPGTGSAMLQAVVAAVAALVVVLKIYWHRLISLFGIRKHPKNKEQDQNDKNKDR